MIVQRPNTVSPLLWELQMPFLYKSGYQKIATMDHSIPLPTEMHSLLFNVLPHAFGKGWWEHPFEDHVCIFCKTTEKNIICPRPLFKDL